MWVHDLRDADASCGGKAVGLARLIAAGLPVPDGFVIDDRAFREVAGALEIADANLIGHTLEQAAQRIAGAELPELRREVEARAAGLGPLLAVRSSATIEDGEAGAAAGVFSSRTAVPADDVWEAIRAVWTSALTPLAATYARRRGGAIAIGVIVQRFVAGERITVYTRPPGQPDRDEMLVQDRDALRRTPRVPEDRDAQLAMRAEHAIAAIHGADVELVGGEIVQARPIVHPVTRMLVPPPPALLAALADGRVWTWDIAHNPDPLSPAQAGLVERVDRAQVSPWSLRVCAGFLYTTRRDSPALTADLSRAPQLEAELERVLGGSSPASIAEAIERYLAFYRIWAGELAPLIAAARTRAPAIGERPSAVESTLAAAARGELSESDVDHRLGALSPAWDIAVPTFGERPGLLRDAIARARVRRSDTPTLTQPDPVLTQPDPVLTQPVLGHADLAERDDALFARAQLMVRRALLVRAAELGLRDDDIFWLPLDETATAIDPDDAHRRASAARSAAERAARWQMPIVVGGPPTPHGPALHGVGTGARVTGRVVRFASLAGAIVVGPGDVVVTRAVTPALAVFVVGCAALVSETGNLLDHGAALARELGIPCIVGCHAAWTQLSDGMLVIVDGQAGTITPT